MDGPISPPARTYFLVYPMQVLDHGCVSDTLPLTSMRWRPCSRLKPPKRKILVTLLKLRWSPPMSAIGRMLPGFLSLRGIASDSDCSFAEVANGDCVTSNSNEMSDRLEGPSIY